MKKQLFILAVTLLSLASMQSCKKDKDKDKEPSITIVGKWKQVSGTYSPVYNGETDYFSSYSDCDKDDILEFKSDNTFEINEGASKCDATDPQIILDGSYSVNSTFTTLNIMGETLNIELTATSLKITATFTDNGENYTDVSNYQKQ